MAIKLNTPVLDRFGLNPDPEMKACEWPDCDAPGPHRAPRSRDEPHLFQWFCKEHAAQYNRAWNFFADLSDDEVEAIVRHDTVWNRPSWPLGAAPAINAFMRGQYKDPFGAFDDVEPGAGAETRGGDAKGVELEAELRRALAVFGLEIPVDAVDVKTRYKALVKRHHPDAQGAGERSDERIKEINHAYTVIMAFLET